MLVEHPILQVVLDPEDQYPLIGTPIRVREPKVKLDKSRATNSGGDNGPDEKKQKLTFFEVSDGEN